MLVAAVVLVIGLLVLMAPLTAASHRILDRHDGFIDARDLRYRGLYNDRFFGRGSLLDDSFGYRSSRALTNLLVLEAVGGDSGAALACAYGSHYAARLACTRALARNACVDPLTASLLLGGYHRIRERDLVLLLALQNNRAC